MVLLPVYLFIKSLIKPEATNQQLKKIRLKKNNKNLPLFATKLMRIEVNNRE